MDHIIPQSGEFSYEQLEEIQQSIVYWNAGHMEIKITRSNVTSFPLPVVLFYMGQDHLWHNYGKSLVNQGLAVIGELDLHNVDFLLHARGIDAVKMRYRGL